MSLFRLDSSIRTEGSVSREVADTVEQTWLEQHPGRTVVRRDVGREPLPVDLWTTAMGAGATPEADRTPEQRAAVALVGELADEVVAADALVIGSPLYNFGIAAHLKAWVDVLITDPRFAPGNQPLAGRPVALVVSRGGGVRARHPARGLGPRHRLAGPDPRRRVGRRRHGDRGRADPRRHGAGDGRAAPPRRPRARAGPRDRGDVARGVLRVRLRRM